MEVYAMRAFGLTLLLALAVQAGDVQPVADDVAKAKIMEFDKLFKTLKEIEQKQGAVFDLHDLPNDQTIVRLDRLLKNRDLQVRNVAALAMGGQGHDVKKAGAALMRSYKKDFKTVEVLSSVFEGWAELGFLGYWPTVKKAMKDPRNSIVIRILGLLGDNKDFRAIPTLIEMYKVAMPKKVSWSTGVVKVDTGAGGTADAEAAKAKWTAKYGAGGSKARAKAVAKARAFDERNFAIQIKRCVKKITGENFENSVEFEDWYVENYVMVHRKIAEMEGKDQDAAERRAKGEIAGLKQKIEEERKKLEEKLATKREKAEKKRQ